jgi:hypothetical protein
MSHIRSSHKKYAHSASVIVPELEDGPPDLLADVPWGPPLVSALTPRSEPVPNKSVDANVSVAIVRLILFILPPVEQLVNGLLEQELLYEHHRFI